MKKHKTKFTQTLTLNRYSNFTFRVILIELNVRVPTGENRLTTGWTTPGSIPGVGGGGDFSSLRVQTGPGVHLTSYKMSTGGFLRE